MIKKFLIKICFLVIVFNLPFISTTNSLLSDEEKSLSSSLESDILDLTLRSGQGNFTPSSTVDAMMPGDSVARDIYVGKTPVSMNLNHDVSYEYLSGDALFCEQLQLKVWYNHYHCDPLGGYVCRDMRLKYDGSLTSLLTERDIDFTIIHSSDLFDINPGDGVEQWFYYSLGLPEGLDASFTNKTCQFNLKVKSWQTDSDGSWGYSDEESLESTISSGEWVVDETAPEALISAPLDFYYNDNFTIDFSANDPDGNVSEVSLYYGFNGGDWQILYINGGYASSLVDDSFAVDLGDLEGDGYYEFMTIAVDDAGNVEADSDADGVLSVLELSFVSFEEATTIDTINPLTMFSVDPVMAIASDAVYNGGFESNDLDGWSIDSNGSDHEATTDEFHSGGHSALIGFKNNLPLVSGAYDAIKQTISLPVGSTSTLSFWYKLSTDNLSSGGFFDVFVNPSGGDPVLVAHNGWDDPLLFDLDLGWKNVSYQLNGLEGQDIEIEFRLSQPDETYKTWVYLDDIRACSSTNHLHSGDSISLFSNDGSGSDNSTVYYSIDGGTEITYTTPFSLTEGLHSISYHSKDQAENEEDNKEIDILVEASSVNFGIVLNEIMPNPVGSDKGSHAKPLDGEWVVLWNNGSVDFSVNQWYLYDEDGHGLSITSANGDNDGDNNNGGEHIVPAGAWLKVYRNGDSDFTLHNDGDTVYLYSARKDKGGILIDSYVYGQSVEGKSFKRDPDGTGSWKDPWVNPVLDVSYDEGNRSVGFFVSHLARFEELSYEIVYQSDNGLDGIIGAIDLGDEDSLSRDNILLGTCSTSVCVLDEGVRKVDFKIVLFDEDENEELELLKTLEIDL